MKRFFNKNIYLVSVFLLLSSVVLFLLHFNIRDLEVRRAGSFGSSAAFRFRKTPSFSKLFPKPTCDTVIAIILCEMNETTKEGGKSAKANDFERQMNQTLVLLKSIVIAAKYSTRPFSCIKIIVISDERRHFEKLKEEIYEKQVWDVEFTKYLRFSHVPVNYPKGFDWMKKLFRPCATLRLFLPDLLPHEDLVLYLDTDIIFLRDVRDLWSEFSKFSNETLAAMAPCLFHYGTKKNSVPYYGTSGLNAGIMLFSLEKIRHTLWTRKIHLLTEKFPRHQIKLADQDILNIYFSYYPKEVNLISCDWNFRPFQCREGSYCEDTALSSGIGALHGNALSFTWQGPEPLFQNVFHSFEMAELTLDFNIKDFIDGLSLNLMRAEEQSHSDCTVYGGFHAMVMNRLVQLIK